MTGRADKGLVMLVDDEAEVLASISQTLELEGYDVVPFSSAAEALQRLSSGWPGIVISDAKMPRMDGMEFLARAMEIDADLPFVIITGHGDIPMAVRAMRGGAYDFTEKTADPDQLVDVVRRAVEKRHLVMENRALRSALEPDGGLEGWILGKSDCVDALRRTVRDIADADIDVLIYGETGTGKELVARCLHEYGRRGMAPFVALNCGALPENTIESELFGHEKGAFTGAHEQRIGKIEYASGGTLFLDEIESMPLGLQVRLLRVLQERVIERLGRNEPVPVDIRVVAATKTDLRAASDTGAFREDLLYRLNVGQIIVPPLRARGDDVLLLFRHFADLAAERYRKPLPDIDDATTDAIRDHRWPGNVRELRNAADRFVLGMPLVAQVGSVGDDEPAGTLAERVARFERATIRDELKRLQGRIGQTAEALGVPRKTLYLRMQKYGLNRKDFGREM